MTGWEIVGLLGWLALAAVTTTVIRQRAALTAARREIAAAEHDRCELAASTERLFIARELHDVVAHNLSLINVQSGIALQQVENKSAKAAGTVAAIKSTSRNALEDVQSLRQAIQAVEVEHAVAATDGTRRDGAILSRPGGCGRGDDPATGSRDRRRRIDRRWGPVPGTAPDGEKEEPRRTAPPPPPREPEPTLSDLDELLRKPRLTGLIVHARVLGTLVPLPKAIDDAATQIVQESLNNVIQHAPGAEAAITIRYTADSVDLTVDNARPAGKSERTGPTRGMGLIAMRERAHALGGALTAGPKPSGGYRVASRLPSRPLHVAADPDLPQGPRRNTRETTTQRPGKAPDRSGSENYEARETAATTGNTPES